MSGNIQLQALWRPWLYSAFFNGRNGKQKSCKVIIKGPEVRVTTQTFPSCSINVLECDLGNVFVPDCTTVLRLAGATLRASQRLEIISLHPSSTFCGDVKEGHTFPRSSHIQTQPESIDTHYFLSLSWGFGKIVMILLVRVAWRKNIWELGIRLQDPNNLG